MIEFGPCINATLYETNRGEHKTLNADGVCDNCNLIMSIFERRRELAAVADELG